MRSGRLVVLALASEAALALAGWGVARALGRPIVVGTLLPDVWIGVTAAVGLAAINHAVLTRLPSSWIVNGVRAVYHEVLLPISAGSIPLASS
jgi:hypothetical protein